MGYRTIQHKITAGNQFDGTLPVGDPNLEDDMEKYPAGAKGGLFDFQQTNPTPLKHFAFKGGGQSSWALVLVDVDGVEYPLESGTNETAVFKRLDHVILLSGQKLKLTTQGASTAQVAYVTVSTR